MKIFKLFIVTFCLTALLITGCKMHVGSGSKNNSGNTDNPTQDDPKDTPTTPENPPADSGDDDDSPPAPKFTLENGVYLVTTENLNYVFDEIIENMPETATVYKIQLQDTELDVVKLAIQLDYLARNDEDTKILLDLDFTKVTEDLVIPADVSYAVKPEPCDDFIFCDLGKSNVYKMTFGNNNVVFKSSSLMYTNTLEEIVFSNGNYTFDPGVINSTSLKKVTFGDGTYNIDSAFAQNAPSLEEIVFKKGNYTLSRAFVNITSLRSVTFEGGSVTFPYGDAFPTTLEYIDFGDADVSTVEYQFVAVGIFNDMTNLTEAYFGDGNLTLYAGSFTNTSLETLKFGNGNKLIGGGCFKENKVLKTVDFNDGDIELGSGAFSSNESLESVHFGKGKITISGGAYGGFLSDCSNLSSVSFDDSVSWQITRNGTTEPIDLSDETTNATAFKDGSLVQAGCVLEPVAYFLDGSYRGTMNNAKAIFQEILKTPPAEETEYKVIFTDSSWDPVALAKALDYLAQNDPETKILLDLNLSNITDDFTIPEKLTDEQMPDGDKYIFYYVDGSNKLNNIQKLTFGDSDIIVGAYGLANLSNLKEVSFGDGDNDIGDFFIQNTSVENVSFGNGTYSFSFKTFTSASSLTNLSFGKGDYTFEDGCFYNSGNVKNLSFQGGNLFVGTAFSGASNPLESIDFGDANIVLHGGGGAFSLLSKLTSLTFGNGNISYDNYAGQCFYQLPILEKITFGSENKHFPQGSFSENKKLTSIDFNDGNLVMENGCFGYCPNIESITFGKGTITFGYGCFNQSKEVKSLYFDTSANWQYEKDGVKTPIDLSDPEFNAELFNIESATSIFSNSVFTQITE